MSPGGYLGGLAFFAATWGGVALATWLLVRRRLVHLRGPELALAVTVVFTAGLIAVHLAPLALGILSRGTVVAATALLVAGAALPRTATPGIAERACVRARAGEPETTASRPTWAGRASWALALGAVGALVLWTGAYLKAHVTVAVLAVDYSAFHLPGVARWIQDGSLWHNTEFGPRFSIGTYPNNGDVVFLAAVLPWRSDAFVRLVNVPYLALTGVAVYALGLRLRAPRPTALLLAAVVVSTFSVVVQGIDRVKPDPIMLACFGAGAVFLVRHCATRRRSDLVLAGLGLGVAFGARWNAAMAVGVALLAWALATWAAGRAPRALARQAAALVGLVLGAGGIWLVRNWVTTGNPVFPAKVSLFGATIFDAPRDVIRERYGYSVAHYLTDGHVLRHAILPDYRVAFGGPGILLGLGVVVAAALALRRRRAGALEVPGGRATLLGLAGAALAIFAIYVVTPASAQGFRGNPWPGLVQEAARWSAPALVLAGGVTAWAAGRLGRWRLAAEVLGAAAVGDGIAQSFDVSGFDLRLTAAVLAGALAAGAVAVALRRHGLPRRAPGPPRPRPSAVAALAVAVAVGVAGVGYADQRRFQHKRYLGVQPTFDWIRLRAPAGHQVGMAGDFGLGLVSPTLPLFGPRLRNHVAYVGPQVRHMLQEYATRAGYVAALRRGRYDLVLVGRGVVPHDGTAAERWTLAAGYAPVARDQFEVLMVRRF